MIVVDELTTRRNGAVIAERDTRRNIELATASDKRAVADNNRRRWTKNAVVFKKNSAFDGTITPNLHLMMPSELALFQCRMLTNRNA